MKIKISMLTVFLCMFSLAYARPYLSIDGAKGRYTGTNSAQKKVSATVTESSESTFEFPKIGVNLSLENVETALTLGYDAQFGVFRGFISSHCDDPGCFDINLLEVKISAKVKGTKLQKTLSYKLYGFENDEEATEEPYGREVRENGALHK